MIVGPISVRDPMAVRDALLSHGWEGDLASLTAGGLELAAFHVSGVRMETLEAMVPLSARLGLELVTGDDWLLLAGPRARLGAFARPWVQPEAVQELAQAIGMAMPSDLPRSWKHALGTIDLDMPVIMGIVNTTPDSFSQSSRATSIDEALNLVDRLIAGGANLIDVGGESTRPDATPIDSQEEIDRVIPVIKQIIACHPDLPISIDTVHRDTAAAALECGAAIINDVTSGRHEPELLDIAATHGAGLVLSHSRGPVGQLANYSGCDGIADITTAVVSDMQESIAGAQAAGVKQECIAVDPGFGFGKRPDQNWRLLRQLDAIVSLGHPVVVGLSRKRFLGDAVDREVEDRDRATAAASALAFAGGANIVRVHNPAAVTDALLVARQFKG